MPKLSPDARRRKAEYNEAWRREHTRQIKIRLNVRTSADVLERLDAVPNVTAYIVGLIRADIAAGRQTETEQHKEHAMKKYAFVKSVLESSPDYDARMDLETAIIDLANFRADGWDVPEDLTAEEYTAIWNKLTGYANEEEHTMKEILIHNGRDSVTPAEALAAYPMETLAAYMDDDAREQVHAELAPCTDEEFLARYLEVAPADLIIP